MALLQMLRRDSDELRVLTLGSNALCCRSIGEEVTELFGSRRSSRWSSNLHIGLRNCTYYRCDIRGFEAALIDGLSRLTSMQTSSVLSLDIAGSSIAGGTDEGVGAVCGDCSIQLDI